MLTRIRREDAVGLKTSIGAELVMAVGLALGLLLAPPAWAGSEAETAQLLIRLMQAGRSVVSEHQEVLNDPTRGDKGFSPEYFGDRMTEKFRETTGVELGRLPTGQQSTLLLTLLEAGKEVVAEAQPVINKQGVAFKGFIPALWGRRAAEKFTKRTGIRLKLTATEYRFAGNKPDEFEASVLRLFSDSRYPKGQEYSKSATVDGRPVLRVMAPEYAGAKCLKCHGEPKGERDITGMRKEGYKEGDLAGAISVVMPVR
ncbi:MAG: DUF3365 domain-containing protein [Nitrospirota bacterium]